MSHPISEVRVVTFRFGVIHYITFDIKFDKISLYINFTSKTIPSPKGAYKLIASTVLNSAYNVLSKREDNP